MEFGRRGRSAAYEVTFRNIYLTKDTQVRDIIRCERSAAELQTHVAPRSCCEEHGVELKLYNSTDVAEYKDEVANDAASFFDFPPCVATYG